MHRARQRMRGALSHYRWQSVGADADLSHMPIGDWAMEIELRAASGLNFVVL